MINPNRVMIVNQPMNRTDLLYEMATMLAYDGVVKPTYVEAILARECEFPTGIDIETHSIAIPHTEYEHVNKTGFAMAITKGNVHFNSADDADHTVSPSIVIMMAIDETTEKVEIIQNIFGWLADLDEVEHVMHLSDRSILAELFMDKVIS